MATAISPVRIPGNYADRDKERFRAILTGAAGIDHDITPGFPFKIIKAELHLSAAPTTSEDFVISINAGDGAVYDVVLLTNDLSVGSVADLVWKPDQEDEYEADDVITIAWTNTDTRTFGLRVVYELL